MKEIVETKEIKPYIKDVSDTNSEKLKAETQTRLEKNTSIGAKFVTLDLSKILHSKTI